MKIDYSKWLFLNNFVLFIPPVQLESHFHPNALMKSITIFKIYYSKWLQTPNVDFNNNWIHQVDCSLWLDKTRKPVQWTTTNDRRYPLICCQCEMMSNWTQTVSDMLVSDHYWSVLCLPRILLKSHSTSSWQSLVIKQFHSQLVVREHEHSDSQWATKVQMNINHQQWS